MSINSDDVDLRLRVERIEQVIGIGHNNPPEPIDEDLPPPPPPVPGDRRLSARQTASRYGVTTRTITRWLEIPELNFPKPEKILERRYWWLSRLQQFDETQLRKSLRNATTT